MDREDLLTVLQDLENGTLSVRPNGEIMTDGNGDWSVEDVESAVAEMTAELSNLLKWCKLAPGYRPLGDPTNTGGLCDANGIPY
jgi:hypothetical protein